MVGAADTRLNRSAGVYYQKMMSAPKIIVQLNGGLGNQMFQYACARSLALRHRVELVLDDWSGFVRDFHYRRRYELDVFPIQARVTTPWERWPIWLHRWRHRGEQVQVPLLSEHWYGCFIQESKAIWLPELVEQPLRRTVWITGCWQSPLYFSRHANQIRTELMPPPARKAHFTSVAEQIRQADSVALGIRLYEESPDPSAHASNGRLKNAVEIQGAIDRLLYSKPNVRFFVFCTHHSPMLDALHLPKDTVFLTHDDGYTGAVERLWLLSLCRNHIFTNSSYYWWGAWLSSALHGRDGRMILAADNFYNRDTLCQWWQKF